jgi:bifunctional non-homologous end joining protein LigD
MLPADLSPQLVANDGVRAMQRAIADPDAYAIEPKVDGVRGLLVFREDGVIEARNRRGLSRDWFRHEPFRRGILALADRLPILWQGSVLDGELTAGRFSATMAALYGSKQHAPALRFVVFDVPVLAGADLRDEPWQARRQRLELLAQAFDVPYELSPVIQPSESLTADMVDGRLEGIVLKRRDSLYRGGSRSGWSKVKDRSWYEREARRFERSR